MRSSPPAIEPDSLLAGLHWRFIVRGALLDFVLTSVTTLPLYLYYAGPDFFAEDQAVADRATEMAYQSVTFNLMTVSLGILCTIVSAYWAGRHVDSMHVRHGGWVAAISLLLILPFLFIPGALDVRQPLWAEIFSLVGILPAGMLGGLIAAQSVRSAL